MGADTISAQMFLQKLDQEISAELDNKLFGNFKRLHVFLGGDVNPRCTQEPDYSYNLKEINK